MRRGGTEDTLPIRDRSERLPKKKSVQSKTRSRRSQGAHSSDLSNSNEDGLQFINLLGTEKHDVQGRNTVRSHARKHAWKNQRERQDKAKQQRVLVKANGDGSSIEHSKSAREQLNCQLPTLDPAGTQSYINQCSKFREVAQRLPQVTTAAAGEYFDETRTGLKNNELYKGVIGETFGCPSASTTILSRPPISPIKFRNGYSDPFNAFPIPLTPRLHQLIQCNPKCIGIHEDPQDSFSFHMGNSPALVFATLAWTSTLTTSSRSVRNAESEYYLYRSITAINNELSDVKCAGLSDATIAAVACLTNMENLNGDESKALIHMNGLRQMVAIRGGMNSLGMNGILRRLVLWADVFCATRWESVPLFPLVELPDLLDLAPLCWFRNPATPKPHFVITNDSLMKVADTGSINLASLMKGVYELAHFLDNAPPKDTGLLDRASFPDRIYIIEHNILCLLSQSQKTSDPCSIITPLLHSLLLYIYTNIRLTPVEGQIRLTLVKRLVGNLQRGNIASLNENFPNELRWILFLGGGAAPKDTPERAFFNQLLQECGCRREWGSWEHIVLLLKGMESGFLSRCKDFWHEYLNTTSSLEFPV